MFSLNTNKRVCFRLVTLAAILTACLAGSPVALAQAPYPARTIRVISPFPPGGFSDLAARAVALGLQQEFGSNVVVENRPGAGGLLATELVFNSPADGYTLLLASNTGLAILPHLVTGLKYDLVKDFTPVSLVSMAPNVLTSPVFLMLAVIASSVQWRGPFSSASRVTRLASSAQVTATHASAVPLCTPACTSAAPSPQAE